MRKRILFFAAVFFSVSLAACARSKDYPEPIISQPPINVQKEDYSSTQTTEIEENGEEVAELKLSMKIGDTDVQVDWEQNESVEALKALCEEEPLTIRMSMYGGFEQVGSIGTKLPRNDKQTTTMAGDIVLYSGNQMVVFYGSNSWAYTRLGHITEKRADEMTELLGNGDTSITVGIK